VTDEPRSVRQRITASYEESLRAFAALCPGITSWDAPTPCGNWSLMDLSGHLLTIARYWHRLLDAAEAGQHCVDLPRGEDLAAMNARDLANLGASSGAERMEGFLDLAGDHLRRIKHADWDVLLGEWSGLGPLTIGQHSGVAIGEWHVHAWDVARSLGIDHRPTDDVVIAEGNRVVRDVPIAGDAWRGVLVAYGRDPGWTPSTGPSSTDR
jgi:uncharacterized protein (TIGR03083 family)